MNRYRRNLFLILMVFLLLFIITGCTQQNTISDKQLTDYYAKSINGLANVIDGYSQSMETGRDYVNEPAQKQIKWIDTTQEKLKKSSENKKAKYFSTFLKSLEDEIREYKANDFENQTSISNDVGQNRKKLEKVLNIDDSPKVLKAKSNIDTSWKNLKKVLAAQPHIDGKSFKNSAGKITFNSVKFVPADNGNKVVEIDYIYENTANNPISAEQALTFSGKFTQETEDSVDTLYPGVPASDWETANRSLMDLESDSALNKLKPGTKKQYVTFLKVDNDNPITFKAKDPETNESIGKIKLSIN